MYLNIHFAEKAHKIKKTLENRPRRILKDSNPNETIVGPVADYGPRFLDPFVSIATHSI